MQNYEEMYFILQDKLDDAVKELEKLAKVSKLPKSRNKAAVGAAELECIIKKLKSIPEDKINVFL